MSLVELKCPCKHCGERIGYPVDMCGKDIKCPHCQQMTTLMVPEVAADVLQKAKEINAKAMPAGGAKAPPAVDDAVRQTVKIDKSALVTAGAPVGAKAAPPPGPGQAAPPPPGGLAPSSLQAPGVHWRVAPRPQPPPSSIARSGASHAAHSPTSGCFPASPRATSAGTGPPAHPRHSFPPPSLRAAYLHRSLLPRLHL